MAAPVPRGLGLLGHLLAGATLGLLALTGQQLGIWETVAAEAGAGARWLNATIGLVWIPMLVGWARVMVLAARAWSTRTGRTVATASVSPELSQLAPLFTGLGFAGTVWGLLDGFGALTGDDLLSKLPELLSGIGAAMTSTLAGLALWAATLSIAAWVPTWSWARIRWNGENVQVSLDSRDLGEGDLGLEVLIEAVRGRRPEALCLAFDKLVPSGMRSRIANAVWSQRDIDLPLKEVTLP